MRLISFDDENSGASLIVGHLIRARAKRNKDALNGLIHWIRVHSSMLQFKMGPKLDHWLLVSLRKAFQFVNFSILIDLGMKKACKFANFQYVVAK